MSTKNKKGPKGGAAYIVLALSVLAVVCVGVYTLMNTMFTDSPKLAPLEGKLPDISVTTTTASPAKPSVLEQVPASESKTQEDKPVSAEKEENIIYTIPVSGDIVKDFSGETLVYSYTMNDFRVHSGIDIACDIGTNVCCFADGTIESVAADPLMGQTITVDHGDGLKSVYQNLSSDLPEGIAEGVKVSSGQVIGTVGDTAMIECAEDDHLHFEVIQNSVRVSPSGFFS
ncbi:MAG: M23 family metallopeptidase [Firmicutes bacterium]|nr:M23 family metallopeptidase [Bacillota bacterium]